MPFRVSPSRIAAYFYHDCPKQLRLGMATATERQSAGLPVTDFDTSPVLRAILEAGHQWEETVVRQLGDRVHIAPGDGLLRDRQFSPQATIDLLRQIQPGEFIYQATLRPPSPFYAHFGIDPSLVQFSDNRPDLIECLERDGQRLLRVIDVKRGDKLSLIYRIQVILYALQLEFVLAECGIDAQVDPMGGAWLGEAPTYEPFPLSTLRPHVEQFLQHGLKAIAQQSPEETFWHINFRCERCGWFDHCRTQAREQDDLSRINKLTSAGKEYLNSLDIRTVRQLGQFLQTPDASQLLSQCASLKGEKHFLQNKVQALHANAAVGHGTASPALPIREDVAVTITIQREPLGRSHYLVGMLVEPSSRKTKDAWTAVLGDLTSTFYPDGKARPYILIAEQPNQVNQIRQDFIQLLVRLMQAVDAFNSPREWKDQLSLQCYLNTDMEKQMLQEWLLEAVADPEVGEDAMRLLLWLQAPELLDLEEHPEEHLPYPAVTLQRVLALLFALPIDISYTLWDTLPALGSTFQYRYNSYYHYQLAQVLQPQAIHSAWYQGQTQRLESLRTEVKMYLYALSALRESIRRQVGENALFSWAAKFQMPRVADIQDPNLSRLAFFVRYEQMIDHEEVRNARSEPREVQIEQGMALLLQAVSPTEFEVIPPANMPLEANPFGMFLLARDSSEGRREQLAFKDRAYASNFGVISQLNVVRVPLQQILLDDDGIPRRIYLSKPASFKAGLVSRGDRFLLLPCHTDFNTSKVIGCLQKLDREGAGLFGELLASPANACCPLPLPSSIEDVLQEIEGHLSLSDSQLEAFGAIREQQVTAVWGPPGTGKTHFLGTVLLALAHAYARNDQPLRILVTGQSHYAIENVLRKLLQLRSSMPATPTLTVAKAGDWKMQQPSGAAVFNDKGLEADLINQNIVIVGATVYATWKAISGGLKPFDVVVVDEASQVRVSEASIPISLVKQKGRLVLTGDDYQLPPIVKGIYPEPQPGQPALHRSIFELIASSIGAPDPVQRARAISDIPYFKMLLENRRMNDVLNSLVSRLLYGDGYHPATDEIASQRLRYQAPNGCSELVNLCLDPNYPVVVVLADSPMATSENRLEAEIVRELVLALKDGLQTEEGNLYPDNQFFNDGVFIVCPHRAQNHLVRRLLKRERDWEPRSDTVDKMQGQEAQAVIVSYGVSDPEYAAQEAEFIYSRNRLNVSITRAKSKCVMILSRQLLEAPPSVWDSPQVAEGLGFMRGVVQLVRQYGETTEATSAGVELTIYRLSAVTL